MKFDIASTTIAVTHADTGALMADVKNRLAGRQGFALATINLDHLVKMRADPAFLADYSRQDFVVADGNPIVWLSRIARRPVGLMPGSDMVIPLAQAAAEAGASVALLGSTLAALEGAAIRLTDEVPGLVIAACLAPPMGFDPVGPQAVALLEQVRDSGAGLCFLALGAPKQERLAALGRKVAPDTGFVAVGAGLDFLSGDQMRAPAWVRKIAMEWMWRALSNPGRLLPRYAACFSILPDEMRKAFRLRRRTDAVTCTRSGGVLAEAIGQASSAVPPVPREPFPEP